MYVFKVVLYICLHIINPSSFTMNKIITFYQVYGLQYHKLLRYDNIRNDKLTISPFALRN